MVGRLDSMITKDSRHMADRNPRASQPGLGRRAGPRRGRGRLRGLAAVGVAPVATATVSVPAAAAITVPAAARVTGPTAVPSTVTGPASVPVPATVTVGTRPVGGPRAVAPPGPCPPGPWPGAPVIQRPSINNPHGPTTHRNQGFVRLAPLRSQMTKQMEPIESQPPQAAGQAGENPP